jgi:hypothetical protein
MVDGQVEQRYRGKLWTRYTVCYAKCKCFASEYSIVIIANGNSAHEFQAFDPRVEMRLWPTTGSLDCSTRGMWSDQNCVTNKDAEGRDLLPNTCTTMIRVRGVALIAGPDGQNVVSANKW